MGYTEGISLKILLSLYLVFAVIVTQFFAAYFFQRAELAIEEAFSALVYVSVFICLVI